MDRRETREAAATVRAQGEQLRRIVADNAAVLAEAQRVIAASRAARARTAELVARMKAGWEGDGRG